VIVKIPERPRNPDFPAPEGPIFTPSARLWIIPKKHAPRWGREETLFAFLVPQNRFPFLEKIADGAARFSSRGPSNVRDRYDRSAATI
jgi:hypothetical protein